MVSKRETGLKKSAGKVAYMSVTDLGVDEFLRKNASPIGFAIAVRALQQNWRQGTVSCKGRGDMVSRSTRKPWKQKGTGRARAGSARSPLWRGGGVIFGPQPRVRTLSIPKKMRRNLFNALLFDFLKDKSIVSLDWRVEGDTPKTAPAYNAIKETGLIGKKMVLFVPSNDVVSSASFANIPGVKVLSFDQPNVFDLADSDFWVFLKKDFEHFKEMVQPWI